MGSDSSAILVPLTVTFVALVATLAVLVLWKRRTLQNSLHGTKTVVNEYGQPVRRSTREHKAVNRWSPQDMGSPTGQPRLVSPSLREKTISLANGEESSSKPKRRTSAKSLLSRAADQAEEAAADTIPAVATPARRAAAKATAATKTPPASAPRATRSSARTPVKRNIA